MKISSAQLWVHDQEEALAFYTEKVGLVVQQDVTLPELGGFRWLQVGAPDQDVGIVLMAIPGEPVMDATSKAKVEELMGMGFAGTVFLSTDDVDADYERMKAKGVEFTQEPTDTPYGRDTGFRDPSGNHLRLAKVKPDL